MEESSTYNNQTMTNQNVGKDVTVPVLGYREAAKHRKHKLKQAIVSRKRKKEKEDG